MFLSCCYILAWKELMGVDWKKFILAALSVSFLMKLRVSFYRLSFTIPIHLSIYCWVLR